MEVISIDELFEQYLPTIKGSHIGWDNNTTHEGFLEYIKEEGRAAGVVAFLDSIDKITNDYETVWTERDEDEIDSYWYTSVVRRNSDNKFFKFDYCTDLSDYTLEMVECKEIIEVKTIKKYI